LKNQGYKVVDLGKSVPSEEIFAAIEREKPDAIGLSALLVTTSREMGAMAKKLHEAKMSVPLIIGGAAVNRQFASRIELVENETRYIGGVFYGKDAFDASRILERVTKGEPPLKLNAVSAPPVAPAPPAAGADGASMPASEPVEHEVIINPMFYGTGEMLIWDSAKLLEEVDRRELYKGYWRTGTLSNEAFERESLVEFDPAFEALKQEILAKSLVDARGYYGIWPVYAKDETIVFLNPSDFKTEEAVFTFPRQKRKAGRSIADWIRPEGDCVALQVVTIGGGIAQRSREYFQKEDKYSRGFYLNGIGSYLTEIIADKVTAEARKALFITDKKQGRRYGFGYPGLPGLEHQKDLLDLLCAADRLGITLTEGFQMIPEHSTVTMFVHHKGADYM
jgi:5-methyltetrahydrofolate--homocysteine methyltransferase